MVEITLGRDDMKAYCAEAYAKGILLKSTTLDMLSKNHRAAGGPPI